MYLHLAARLLWCAPLSERGCVQRDWLQRVHGRRARGERKCRRVKVLTRETLVCTCVNVWRWDQAHVNVLRLVNARARAR
jgi:hypothetical protein